MECEQEPKMPTANVSQFRRDVVLLADGTFHYVADVPLGNRVFGMSVSAFEFFGNEPSSLGGAFIQVQAFQYRFQSGSSQTHIDVQIQAIDANSFFSSGTQTPFPSPLNCSLVFRYANG